MADDETELDELLGRTRCARCGQILRGEIECPFCSLFPERVVARRTPTWIYLTACFLTAPLSLPFIVTTRRLGPLQKVFAASGLLLWALVYWLV